MSDLAGEKKMTHLASRVAHQIQDLEDRLQSSSVPQPIDERRSPNITSRHSEAVWVSMGASPCSPIPNHIRIWQLTLVGWSRTCYRKPNIGNDSATLVELEMCGGARSIP